MHVAFNFGFLIYLGYLNTLLYIENDCDTMVKYSAVIILMIGITELFLPMEFIGILIIVLNALWLYTRVNRPRRDDLKNKNSENLVKWGVIGNFICHSVWFLFGVLKSDIFLSIGFLIRLILSTINLIIFFWIHKFISDDFCVIVLLKKYLKVDDIKENDTVISLPRISIENKLLGTSDFH